MSNHTNHRFLVYCPFQKLKGVLFQEALMTQKVCKVVGFPPDTLALCGEKSFQHHPDT